MVTDNKFTPAKKLLLDLTLILTLGLAAFLLPSETYRGLLLTLYGVILPVVVAVGCGGLVVRVHQRRKTAR